MLKEEDDPIEKILGSFGRYQIWIYILITISRLPAEFQCMNVVFLIPNVNYVCLDNPGLNVSNVCPCENPEYDQTDIVSSVTSEWNLICDRASWASMAQSIFQVGFLAGSIFYGYISDRYGRKLAVMLALFSDALFGTLSALVPELWMFFIIRIFIGTAAGGTIICCYIMTIELVGKSFRNYMLGLIEVSYVTGYSLLPVVAYYIREWRNFQLALSVPWLLVIVMFWLLPESPRWLITMGKKEEAIALLTLIAKRNGRTVENIEQIINEAEKQSIPTKERKHGTYLDLFKTTKLRLYSIVTATVWACCTATFYGINQYIGRIGGNLYLNVFISAILHLPGLALLVLASLYLNRKTAIISTFMIAALCLLLMILRTGLESMTIALAAIGQIGAYASLIQIFLICSEIFPTVIRNSAMSFSAVFGRIGGFAAPFIVNIGTDWITLVILSTVTIFAAVLCCFFPETKNTTLLNSIDQIEAKYKNKDKINAVTGNRENFATRQTN